MGILIVLSGVREISPILVMVGLITTIIDGIRAYFNLYENIMEGRLIL